MATTIVNKIGAVIGSQGNTGFPKSIHNPGMQKGMILIPKGSYIPNANLGSAAAVLAYLKTKLYEDRAGRYFIVGRWENVEKKGSDRATETFNSGSIRTIRRGTMGSQFTVINGGKWYQQKLMSFDDTSDQYDAIIFDDKNNVIGVDKLDDAGLQVFGGRALNDLYIGDWMEEDGTTGNKFLIDVQYTDSNEINKQYAFMNVGTSVFTTLLSYALLDVTLVPAVSAAANVIKLTATTDYGETDLYDYYAALLAQTGAWSVINDATGAPMTISAVASNAGIKGWFLTITTGTGVTARVTLTSPKTLAGLATPVYGIEALNTLTYAIP